MLAVHCQAARVAYEDLARRAKGLHQLLWVHLALDGHVHISGPDFVNLHHLVVLESLVAWVDMSAPRAQVQSALVAAKRCLLGTPSIALLVSLGEVLHLDNVSRHVVGDEVISWGGGLAKLAGNVAIGRNGLRRGALGADGVEAGEEKGILADEALPARTLARRCHGQ